jgi:threonylcarbamoyladenosine tRNA methylthiotransferase MtaB
VESAPTDPATGWSGYTPNFLRVNITQSPDDNLENRIVEAQLQRLTDAGDAMSATLVE